ncbi:hypothetical protein L9F63_019039 [Diploptera punctata]|uniref:Uncharacterized protein n=1 Tax=Diploptera punctata TaxID=6984 RepID=A0AAD7ZVJ0_DIPPU|nr:hypothetical protein L9F63_019039 [Diploptera punctata]
MTDTAMDLKERCVAGEKYVCYLRSLAVRAARVMTTMQNSSKSFLLLSQKLLLSVLNIINSTPNIDKCGLKLECEKLLAILEREVDIEEIDAGEASTTGDLCNVNAQIITDKIKYLEAKQKLSDSSFLPPTSSAKSIRSDVDEKYPESWSKESLIDLNNVINLPPVPEDIFTSFSKPVRSSSLSSLKGLRKVKLFLQRAAQSEDDAQSEYEEHEIIQDEPSTSNNEIKSFPTKKSMLGNIKEEPLSD